MYLGPQGYNHRKRHYHTHDMLTLYAYMCNYSVQPSFHHQVIIKFLPNFPGVFQQHYQFQSPQFCSPLGRLYLFLILFYFFLESILSVAKGASVEVSITNYEAKPPSGHPRESILISSLIVSKILLLLLPFHCFQFCSNLLQYSLSYLLFDYPNNFFAINLSGNSPLLNVLSSLSCQFTFSMFC